MLNRIKAWLSDGVEVRIFTARASAPESIPFVQDWLEKHGLPRLSVTCSKDFATLEIWDDRAIQIRFNTGERADGLE